MKVLLLLWIALILLTCCGNVRSYEEEEETTPYYYDETGVTPTPDYDYNATFDYYYVTGNYTMNLYTTKKPDGGCSSINHQRLVITTLLMSQIAQRLTDF